MWVWGLTLWTSVCLSLFLPVQVAGCVEGDSGEEEVEEEEVVVEREEEEEEETEEETEEVEEEEREEGEESVEREKGDGDSLELNDEMERKVSSFITSPQEEAEESVAESSDSASESAVSSVYSASTTTSYLHGDRATVQRLVARGLKKKQHQIHRRVRSKKEAKAAAGTKKNGAKNKGKTELKWSLDSEW